jgi:hypothetical protein
VQAVTTVVTRDPDVCWRAFIDVAALTAWVPGLRRAQVLLKSMGLPAEVLFEFATSLTYTLVYSYDAAKREVRWEPKLGKRDGVSGFARFESSPTGTLVTYSLEQGEGRNPAERTLSDQQALVDAFARWMNTAR